MKFKKFSTLSLAITDLFNKDKWTKFFFKIFAAYLSFSTKVTFSAPLDKHSIPKDPTPEYKSNIFAFSTLESMKCECFKILKIFSLTESFRGLVLIFFK